MEYDSYWDSDSSQLRNSTGRTQCRDEGVPQVEYPWGKYQTQGMS